MTDRVVISSQLSIHESFQTLVQSNASTTGPASASQVNRKTRVLPKSTELMTKKKEPNSIHNLSPLQIRETMIRFEASLRKEQLLGSPRVDQLLTLIQFNVLRALFDNATIINCATKWLEEDAMSPWYSLTTTLTISSLDALTITAPASSSSPCLYPASLLPSPLQCTTPHHPWIDLFPFPRMRDNLLRASDTYDEWALCNVLVDFCHVPQEQTGLIVWTDPWEQPGWEVSEAFLGKWRWVVEGCEELMASTRHWRRIRVEQELVF